MREGGKLSVKFVFNYMRVTTSVRTRRDEKKEAVGVSMCPSFIVLFSRTAHRRLSNGIHFDRAFSVLDLNDILAPTMPWEVALRSPDN